MTATPPDPGPGERPPPGQLRASDADRHQVAERLRSALDEGRLELLEYDERLKSTYAARTYDDLTELVADLPPAAAVVPTVAQLPVTPPRPGLTRRVGGALAQPAWRSWAGTGVILVTIWLITSIASGGLVFFWPMFPLGIWGAVLVAGSIWGDSGHNHGPGHGGHGQGHGEGHGEGHGQGHGHGPKPDTSGNAAGEHG
jgi:Domain of unknown function (DUF1707)